MIALGVITLLHVVGFIGLISPLKEDIQSLSSLTLAVSAFLLLAKWNAKQVAQFLMIAVAAWLLEFTGVHTGWPFGAYSYGSSLGPALFEIPLIIGLNWLMLLLGCASLANALKFSAFQGAFFAASAMTMLDFLIEPIAIDLDFWSWEATAVPLSNYAAWFIASFVFALLTRPILQQSRSMRAEIFIFIQFTFFGCLNLFL